MLAVALAALGLLILGWPVFSDGGWLGPAFALLSALSWAVGTVYLKRLDLDVAPVVSTAIQLTSATLLSLLGLALDPRDTPISISTGALLGIAYNTVLGTIVAYLLWFSVLDPCGDRIARDAARAGVRHRHRRGGARRSPLGDRPHRVVPHRGSCGGGARHCSRRRAHARTPPFHVKRALTGPPSRSRS